MFEDKVLVCKECGQEFVFTAGEQAFYAERGFQNEPQRCKPCRDARKNAWSPRVFHRHLCDVRRRGQGSLRAQERPSCLLQRVLRQDSRAAEQRLSRNQFRKKRLGFRCGVPAVF